MAKAGKREQVAVSLNPELRDALAARAREEKQTASNMARVFIERALETEPRGARDERAIA
jgi:hypothetical protein